jgi:riboflavin-specific deaminase-like protein
LAASPERPFVVAQLGQSLDGRIATVTGDSRYINGEAALTHLHALRACVDAVIVGIGTIIADDPLLTVRRVKGQNPARIVIDPRGRLPLTGKWLADDVARMVVSPLKPKLAGVEHIAVPDRDGQLNPHEIVAALFARGLRRILVEGGARTISNFIDADCIDRLHILQAPVLIGSGKMGLELAPQGELARARRPLVDIYPLAGGDVVFDCALR